MFRSILLALVFTSLVAAYAPCPETQSEMSVEGVNGIFCVQGYPICNADIYDGSCPDIQEGLTYGSYCGVVASGVYGCKTLNATSILTYAPAMTPAPATGTPAQATGTPTPATETPATATGTPAPATETPAPTDATATPSLRPGCEVA